MSTHSSFLQLPANHRNNLLSFRHPSLLGGITECKVCTMLKFYTAVLVTQKLTLGGLPNEKLGDAHREIRIKPLKETNLGVAGALFDP